MKVLSLFDGLSCGRVALERAGIPVETYYASEVDKYAMSVAQAMYPDTIQIGDVCKVDFTQYIGKVDMIIGGSPCQDLSIAKQNRQGLQGERSRLFWEYIKALTIIKPKYFLLENVASMKNEDKDAITAVLRGIYPETECVMINSALVSAQQRKRYYWTNWHVEQPQDKGILLKDILESGTGCTAEHYAQKICNTPDKANTLMARDYKGFGNQRTNGVLEPVVLRCERTETAKKLRKDYEAHKIHHGFNEFRVLRPRPDNKSNILSTVLKDNIVVEPVGAAMRTREDKNGKFKRLEVNGQEKSNAITSVQTDSMICEPMRIGTIAGTIGSQGSRIYSVRGKSVSLNANGGGGGAKTGLYKIDLPDGDYIVRKLTPRECARLQTYPERCFDVANISNTQWYKAFGNGWTVDVIAHIFKQIPLN